MNNQKYFYAHDFVLCCTLAFYMTKYIQVIVSVSSFIFLNKQTPAHVLFMAKIYIYDNNI